MDTTELTPDQRELVAIGTSIGAGCQPCFNYHAKAGVAAGVTAEQLQSALGRAQRVTAEALGTMSGHIRAHLAFTKPGGTKPTELGEVLAGLGAALGANDRTNIERHIKSATSLGATRAQLEQAIAVAKSTQENAMRLHHRAATHALDEIFGPQRSATDGQAEAGCGCGAEAGADAVAEPVAEPVPA